MKLTRHNGRSGKNGAYNPKHNDRRFDVKNSEHIDLERLSRNVYWDCYQGFHYPEDHEQEEKVVYSFEEIEKLFYHRQYQDYCEAQHERNRKNGHPERDRITEDLRLDKKTCPEESLIQIGTIEQSVSAETLTQIATQFFEAFENLFGEHVHILDWSLHLDESTPHIHERHVFDCPNRYGEIAPQQEKALEALGIELPDPDRKPGKNNNRKMTFDSICRTLLFDISLEHGLHLDQEPSYGGRKYLEKQDYIRMNQKRRIIEQSEQISDRQEKLVTIKEEIREEDARLLAVQEKTQKAEKEFEQTADSLIRASSDLRIVKRELKEADEELEEQEKRKTANRSILAENERMMEKGNEALAMLNERLMNKNQFMEDISTAAYNAAVAAVTEKVVEETHNMDFNIIVRFREKMKVFLSDSPGISKMISTVLGDLLREFSGVTKHISEKLAEIFGDPVQKEKMKKPIKDAIRQRFEQESYSAPDQEEPEQEVSRGMAR